MTYNGIRVRVTKNRGERVREIGRERERKRFLAPFAVPLSPYPPPLFKNPFQRLISAKVL